MTLDSYFTAKCQNVLSLKELKIPTDEIDKTQKELTTCVASGLSVVYLKFFQNRSLKYRIEERKQKKKLNSFFLVSFFPFKWECCIDHWFTWTNETLTELLLPLHGCLGKELGILLLEHIALQELENKRTNHASLKGLNFHIKRLFIHNIWESSPL